MLVCQFCSRQFKNAGGKATHEPYCVLNPCRVQRPKSPDAHKRKGTPSWNSGLVGDPRCKRSDEYKESRKGKSTGLAATPEGELLRRKRISERVKGVTGGYREGSGRGKKGWYSGFFCDSSWELAYVIYCLDHGFSIQRNTEKLYYEYLGQPKRYIPDFIVDGELVEIKGYKSDEWLAKLSHNPQVRVLYEKDLKDIISYVVERYGKDYVLLYNTEV